MNKINDLCEKLNIELDRINKHADYIVERSKENLKLSKEKHKEFSINFLIPESAKLIKETIPYFELFSQNEKVFKKLVHFTDTNTSFIKEQTSKSKFILSMIDRMKKIDGMVNEYLELEAKIEKSKQYLNAHDKMLGYHNWFQNHKKIHPYDKDCNDKCLPDGFSREEATKEMETILDGLVSLTKICEEKCGKDSNIHKDDCVFNERSKIRSTT